LRHLLEALVLGWSRVYSDKKSQTYPSKLCAARSSHQRASGVVPSLRALWTPTILVMDANGVERYRIEGYLPKNWFRARLEMGLGRVAFMHKNGRTPRRFMPAWLRIMRTRRGA